MKWVRYGNFDEIIDVSLEDAIKTVREVAKTDGILIGLSGGAVLHAVKKLAEKGIKGIYVVVIPDHGYKYLNYLNIDNTNNEHVENYR